MAASFPALVKLQLNPVTSQYHFLLPGNMDWQTRTDWFAFIRLQFSITMFDVMACSSIIAAAVNNELDIIN